MGINHQGMMFQAARGYGYDPLVDLGTLNPKTYEFEELVDDLPVVQSITDVELKEKVKDSIYQARKHKANMQKAWNEDSQYQDLREKKKDLGKVGKALQNSMSDLGYLVSIGYSHNDLARITGWSNYWLRKKVRRCDWTKPVERIQFTYNPKR
ncbi:hypothetical protein RyT2_05910 [Pseudolactococcus yaeyamensis]